MGGCLGSGGAEVRARGPVQGLGIKDLGLRVKGNNGSEYLADSMV